MSRLNNQAWQILNQQVQKMAKEDPLMTPVVGEIIQKRLAKLRQESGKPATYEELGGVILDIVPNFPESVLKKAAKANSGLGVGKISTWLGVSAVGVGGLVGLIWLLNLPYPMIRRPVARVAPIVLIPSYLKMDKNYREAIAHVEQADQLINQATSYADIELGAQKVELAQQNLDALPVWFLGYEPRLIRTFFSFSWHFTFDEYEAARAIIGRMDAVVFQEKNAYQQFQEAETQLATAKAQYEQATTNTDKQTALSSWQNAIDKLTQLPQTTFAGKQAQTNLVAYQRDFQQISGTESGASRTNTLIAAAQQFGNAATVACGQVPLPTVQWEQCKDLWEQAIGRLEQVPLEDPGYLEAQTILATYRLNLGQVQIKLEQETSSQEALENARQETEELLAAFPAQPKEKDYNRVRGQLQSIINELHKVESNTTAYEEAQSLLGFAEAKLAELN